jgi:hypothetical protein
MILEFWPWRRREPDPAPADRPDRRERDRRRDRRDRPGSRACGGRGGTGPYDVIAKAEANSLDELGELVIPRIQSVAGVSRTLTCPVL